MEHTLDLIVEWRTIADRIGELSIAEEVEAAKLRTRLGELSDTIRQELIVDREIAPAAGRSMLAKNLRWIDQPFADGWHAARECLVELRGSLTKATEIEAIVGPVGPKLAASQLHPAIWDSVRNLWDKGEHGPAIHVASVALEAHIQGTLDKRNASGVKLSAAFALDPPSAEWPRFRIRGLDERSETYESAHQGAGHLLRGAFGFIRNLASHPGGFDDMSEPEALEQLAVLSTVARIVDRCDVERHF